MTMTAPELPTTRQLQLARPLSSEALASVTQSRIEISLKVQQLIPGTIAFMGVCGPTINSIPTIRKEGLKIKHTDQEVEGLTAGQRNAVWKPRSNPDDWHGLETTHPEAAHRLIIESANEKIKNAMEIASLAHLERYGNALSLMWSGSRNMGNLALLEEIALAAPEVPLAGKNGLDGDVDEALKVVDHLNELRSDIEGAAPVVLMYRGGTNAQDPNKWECEYRRALALTNGNMFTDWAHGAEMAHDPNQKFGKSSEGQLRVMEHIIALAEEGETSVGHIAEASDATSDTDPHAPFTPIMEGMIYINSLRMKGI